METSIDLNALLETRVTENDDEIVREYRQRGTPQFRQALAAADELLREYARYGADIRFRDFSVLDLLLDAQMFRLLNRIGRARPRGFYQGFMQRAASDLARLLANLTMVARQREGDFEAVAARFPLDWVMESNWEVTRLIREWHFVPAMDAQEEVPWRFPALDCALRLAHRFKKESLYDPGIREDGVERIATQLVFSEKLRGPSRVAAENYLAHLSKGARYREDKAPLPADIAGIHARIPEKGLALVFYQQGGYHITRHPLAVAGDLAGLRQAPSLSSRPWGGRLWF